MVTEILCDFERDAQRLFLVYRLPLDEEGALLEPPQYEYNPIVRSVAQIVHINAQVESNNPAIEYCTHLFLAA